MFQSLTNVFYDGEQSTLTTMGYILFIGVAIMLVMMVLRWILSLVRGV
ncbi:MAG: hypothetical protein IAA85_05430 [Firmicutes bacterium]|nr:hypothetical protein [Candidatus Alectryobacillus merdavium]